LPTTASFLRPGCEARRAPPNARNAWRSDRKSRANAHANSRLQVQQLRSGASKSAEESADWCLGRHVARPLRMDAGRESRVPARAAARLRLRKRQGSRAQNLWARHRRLSYLRRSSRSLDHECCSPSFPGRSTAGSSTSGARFRRTYNGTVRPHVPTLRRAAQAASALQKSGDGRNRTCGDKHAGRSPYCQEMPAFGCRRRRIRW